MIITKLVLVGYKRLALRNIRYFEYTPTEKTQAILGSNGSGKSSVMKELSPLPANKNDYEEGGYKEIHITHKGKSYILTCQFETDSSYYYFKMGDDNLNPGLNITTYKDLVKEHFNYTQDIHDLLTGITRFTRMSVSERRSWMMRISDADYSYAVKYFKKLSEQARDLQGAINRSTERLAKEIQKDLTPEQEKELRDQIAELTHTLNGLIDIKQVKPSLKHEDYIGIINSHYLYAEKLISSLGGIESYQDEVDLSESIFEYRGEMTSLQAQMKGLGDKLEGLFKKKEEIAKTNSANVDDVIKGIKDIQEEIDVLSCHDRLNIPSDDPQNAHNALTAVKDSLTHIFLSLDEIDRHSPSMEKMEEYRVRERQLATFIGEAKKEADKLFLEIKDLEEAKQKGMIHCPSCSYKWVPNYSDAELASKKSLHSAAIKTIEIREQELKKVVAWIDNATKYFSLITQLSNIGKQFDILRQFFILITSPAIVIDNPTIGIQKVDVYLKDLVVQSKILALKAKEKEQTKLLEAINAMKSEDNSKLNEIIEENEKLLANQQNRWRYLNTKLKEAQFFKETYSRLVEVKDLYIKATVDRKQFLNDLAKSECLSALDEFIRSVKMRLSELEQTLSRVTIQKAQIAKLQEQIKEDKENLAIFKLAIKALSPTEGLIARAMTGFINHFVNKLNLFIENIWSYPFKLIPIDIASEEGLDLDYKFSIEVNGNKGPSDVSMASTAQREIIDLAFMAVAMSYLGLDQYPLFLDEFAASMDHAHRLSAYRTIDLLTESSQYSQVFLISHYEQAYGGLTNQETIVLCAENVALPPNAIYNRNVVMQ